MNKRISNRELLRNFKSIKAQLMSGELDSVEVTQKNGKALKITISNEQSPAQKMLNFARKNPLKNIKRPSEDLFE